MESSDLSQAVADPQTSAESWPEKRRLYDYREELLPIDFYG
jgi:hypothetical protein